MNKKKKQKFAASSIVNPSFMILFYNFLPVYEIFLTARNLNKFNK